MLDAAAMIGAMKPITFTIPGDPVPQPRVRVSTRGGFARAYVPSKHPIHDYRRAIEAAAQAAGLRQTGDLLEVRILAVFARPKSHRKKSGLKSDAPQLPRADVDNIAKGVLDALQSVMGDDTRVQRLTVCKKYDDCGLECCTHVEVRKTLENKGETHATRRKA